MDDKYPNAQITDLAAAEALINAAAHLVNETRRLLDPEIDNLYRDLIHKREDITRALQQRREAKL